MQRILIANRGEIAVRVARACADASYTSLAVYSDQDFDAMHVRIADEAYALNGDSAATSYLDIDRILEIAREAEADAIHPGYGFLSENAEFARAVETAGMVFIGPTAETIEQLGDKVTARQIATSVGAPLVPGTDQPLNGASEAIEFAKSSGLPVAIKAAYGGGGRGLKVVRYLDEVAEAFESATREAIAAFGRGECYIERFVDKPRHIEAQIMGDGHGNVVVVGDRDCSLQRRNQKLVEEAPAPDLAPEIRQRIHEAARNIGAAVKYRGAGTVEFLLGDDGTASFLEVNTRLQVEHSITEATTGIDLVLEQFRIAEGHDLSISETPEPIGHAFEFRINAEDPGRGFLPTPGKIHILEEPAGPGIRWDAGVRAGDSVEGAFDSMIAKLIVHGTDRKHALARSRRAINETQIEGVATVLPFAKAVLEHESFTVSPIQIYTQWIETDLMPELEAAPRSIQFEQEKFTRVAVEVDGRRVQLGFPGALLAGAFSGSRAMESSEQPASSPTEEAELSAPVTGSLVRQLVGDGSNVSQGEPVAVCEAMKTETTVHAHISGTITWTVNEGDAVTLYSPLARIES